MERHHLPAVIALAIWVSCTMTASQGQAPKSAWIALETGSQKLQIQDGQPQDADFSSDSPQLPVAWGTLKNDINESGWAFLQIETNERAKDEVQAYAAGALEAYLTRQLIENHWTNMFGGYLNAQGDIQDLEHALGREEDFYSIDQIMACSAVVKVVGDSEGLYFGHDAWFVYRAMLRFQKHYIFPWHLTALQTEPEDVVPGHTWSISSYPGMLMSWDSFYLTSGGLAITETQLLNDNQELQKLVTPSGGIPAWVRAAVSSRLATSGEKWVRTMATENLGTYFPEIFKMTLQPENVEKYGDYYSYENSPRAKMFQRDNGNLTDMDSVVAYLRYNDYKNDPLSQCNCTPPYNPVYAIAARTDLLDANGQYDVPGMNRRAVGGIDAKVTSHELFPSLEFVGESGPTWNTQPPFQWSTSGLAGSHVGQPDKWQFKPVQHKWEPARRTSASS
ncbi:hypothetical protein HPB49_006198 [Dermacentor silvarum]|uniref:Uncharacterized protein n=1 Tax=Dermacentor silvarum TaxID=543639 RepID=A0ACB8CDP1_DERSI|nr:hypothetical protein HPB49_006198 [Dermacentor silvarum]